MTQNERIKRYLEEFGSITAREADRAIGVMRLSARINELRAEGIKIRTAKEVGKNRYGERTQYARYVLEK